MKPACLNLILYVALILYFTPLSLYSKKRVWSQLVFMYTKHWWNTMKVDCLKPASLFVHRAMILYYTTLSSYSKSKVCKSNLLYVHITLIVCFTTLWVHTVTVRSMEPVCLNVHIALIVCFTTLSSYYRSRICEPACLYLHKALILCFTALSLYSNSKDCETSLSEINFTQRIDSVLHNSLSSYSNSNI